MQTVNGVERGIPLTEKEAKMFPPQTVSPRLAVGVREPETVILWQLNVNVCPHVNAANQCQTYGTRPLICRSFPVVAGSIPNRCRVFSYRKVGVSYSEPYTMASQLEASERLNIYIKNGIRKHPRRGLKIWEYDLKTQRWVNEQNCSAP